jgi:hypothetical protein
MQLVGDTKQNVDTAASALECIATSNNSNNNTTTYVYSAVSNEDSTYALLPFHDSLGMPFVPKYAAPFRIVDYTTQDNSSVSYIDILGETVTYTFVRKKLPKRKYYQGILSYYSMSKCHNKWKIICLSNTNIFLLLLTYSKTSIGSIPNNLYKLASTIEALTKKTIENGFTVSGLVK